MKMLKNISEVQVVLNDLPNGNLTLDPGDEIEITASQEEKFIYSNKTIENIQNGNLQVGDGIQYFTDAVKGECYFRILGAAQYAESESESTTPLTSYQTKLVMAFTPPVTGYYILHWTSEISNSASSKATSVLVDLDNITTFSEARFAPTAGEYFLNAGMKSEIQLIKNQVYNFRIKYRAEASTAKIRRARLWVRRA